MFLTSFEVLDSQGYLWLPHDLAEVIKLIGVTFKQIFFFNKILYVIPSALLSFLPYYCHSFWIFVIPSGFLSFFPDFCHSFQTIVIPSGLVSFLLNIVIPSKLLPFQIFVILNSSSTLPYPKGEKNGNQRWPYM